jgi:hypothetical protein
LAEDTSSDSGVPGKEMRMGFCVRISILSRRKGDCGGLQQILNVEKN